MTETFTIDALPYGHGSRLLLPIHPIRAVVSIVTAKGETVNPAHVLVDTALGTIRYAANMDFTEHPYTVTVER